MKTALRTLAIVLALGITAAVLASHAPAAGDPPSSERGGVPSGKPEDPDYAKAVKAIEAKQFAAAIPLLEGVVKRDGSNANAYNWLGYAVRKNGDPAASIPIYQKALALDPKHRGAHEYIGEAYLMLNDLPKAKEHPARLDKLCFFSCEEYRDLKKAIEVYETSRKTSR
ncbi:MAG: tetratricopeptide repeat protein [Candidatus Rokubacteria bacterium]|nr:tetratricopeptide repeat protein [Candidatus Rokubacteria bacterium]